MNQIEQAARALRESKTVLAVLWGAKLVDGTYVDKDCSITMAMTNIDAALASLEAAKQEPQDWTKDAREYGNALNDAAWVFIETCPEKSTRLFNHCKPALRAAILKYAESLAAAPSPGSGTAMRIVSRHLDAIERECFKPGMKMTFIARDPTNPEADFLVTEDDLSEVAELLIRSSKREDINAELGRSVGP